MSAPEINNAENSLLSCFNSKESSNSLNDLESFNDLEVPFISSKGNLRRATVHYVKAMIGSGILFLPNAFHNGGWLISLLIMFISAWLNVLGVQKLAECHSAYGGSYVSLGQKALGFIGGSVIGFQLMISQLCFATTSVVFNGYMLKHVLDLQEVVPCIFGQLIFLIPLSFLRDLSRMRLTNGLSVTCIIVSVLFLGYTALSVLLGGNALTGSRFFVSPGVVPINSERWLSFIGNAVYVFEGIALALPIREHMPTHLRDSFDHMVGKATGVVAFVVSIFALLCYLAWGTAVNPVVLLEPPSSPVLTFIQMIYMLAVACGFPLTMNPVFSQMESWVATEELSPRSARQLKTYIRIALTVGVTCFACFALRNIEIFMSFVGALCAIPIAFLMPALIHYRLVKQSCDLSLLVLLLAGVLFPPLIIHTNIGLW